MSDADEAESQTTTSVVVETTPTNTIARKIDGYVEKVLRILLFWEKDDKKLGKIIRILHHSFMYMVCCSYIIIHTFFPSYILFFLLYMVCGIIWIHHIFSWGCAFSRIEQKLIGDSITLVGPILEIFDIPVTPQTTDGVMIMGATVVMFFLTFELLSRTIINVKSWIPF